MATMVIEPTTSENFSDTSGPRNDRAELNDNWLGQVTRYVVRDIDCSLVDGVLEFSFRNPQLAQNLPGGGLNAVITMLRTIPPLAPVTKWSPLDIGAKGAPVYIFFRIVGPTNMTFSSTQEAVTHKNRDDKPYYGNLRHVNATQIDEDPLSDCKIVYFVADPLAPDVEDYKHGFNLNVELAQVAGGTRKLAFEIDPDIRHPGGSATDP